MKPSPISLINSVRDLEADHAPNGWPAVKTEFLTAMADQIQSDQIALATAKAGVKELTQDFKALAKQGAATAKELNQEISREKIKAELQTRLITDLELRLDSAVKALDEIHIAAHCAAKAGPLSIPDMQSAYVKLLHISAMATNGVRAAKGKTK